MHSLIDLLGKSAEAYIHNHSGMIKKSAVNIAEQERNGRDNKRDKNTAGNADCNRYGQPDRGTIQEPDYLQLYSSVEEFD